ncbi:TonB-dependent receptor [Tamlana flava]|uniref:TonB-dependent receptor n=1 Tax=Tamlana flava TaxID=3158572 RepID=UPI00351BC38B
MNSLIRIAKYVLGFILLSSVGTSILHGQKEKSIPDIEKIYLHTDRSTYILGEDLWYKAYSVFAYNNLLFSKGNVLYVDLIAPDSKIIATNKTLIKDGLGHGDFKLTDSIGVKPGMYQIRAYTNWSRNYGEDFVFKKEVEILDVFKDAADRNNTDMPKNQPSNQTKNKGVTESLTIIFFPEGGSLLEDAINVVAFKATDNYGNALKVKGKVFDSDNALVSLFVSTHDGMGKFQFSPVSGKSYYATISISAQKEVKQELPKVNQQGYLLSHKKLNSKRIISIKTNEETLSKNPDAPVTLICRTRGVTYFSGTQPLANKTLSFELRDTDFPEGISQLTLYDHANRPQSERLVYIEKEHDFDVTLTTNKTSYKPEEMVEVNVSSKSNTGDGVPASFSLSVTDMNGMKIDKDLGTNICSNFLLESDIRGKVHNPGYYFDKSNKRRLQNLDLLLLTQGWRNFIWKTIPQPNDTISYKAEKGFVISGKVEQLLGEKPKADQNVNLVLMAESGMNIHDTQTDTLGIFKFKDLVFFGKTKMFLNTRNEKGKARGELLLDEFDKEPLPTNYSKDEINLPKTDSVEQAISEHVYKKFVTNGIAPENILDEVEIIAKKKPEGPESLYGTADNTYVVDDKTPYFNNMFQFIQNTLPGMSFGDTLGFMRFGGAPAMILVDGSEYPQDVVRSMSVDDVAKIEAFKGPSAALFGSRGGSGVILIYTKTGTINNQPKKVFHSVNKEIDGFYSARIFYSPNPEDAKDEWGDKSAVRNTIYWNPYVHPDATGKAKETFYNSAIPTKAKVTLEGITATGIPIVKKVFYTIEK